MKQLTLAICLMFALSPLAMAADKASGKEKVAEQSAEKAPSEKQLAQRQKMKDCNKEAKAKEVKGAARKEFMSDCLKN